MINNILIWFYSRIGFFYYFGKYIKIEFYRIFYLFKWSYELIIVFKVFCFYDKVFLVSYEVFLLELRDIIFVS